MHKIEPHATFFLLKNCLWIPKLLYLLRSSPAHAEVPGSLQQLDSALRGGLSSIVNVNFDDDAWEQAVLLVTDSVRHGGLGFRKTMDVPLPAYLASLLASARRAPLIRRILPEHLHSDFLLSNMPA